MIYGVQVAGSTLLRKRSVVLYRYDISEEVVADIRKRLHFYAPSISDKVVEVDNWFFWRLLTTDPLLITGVATGLVKLLLKLRRNTYYVDSGRNPFDCDAWRSLSCDFGSATVDIIAVQQEFIQYVQRIHQSQGYTRVYLFGTGPSLERAMDHKWDDGYRVVCNTIVRDKALWNHINPHFFVAADTIYHFEHTAFARKFREDLKKRLSETDTKFMYPLFAREIIFREFSEFQDKLMPFPMGNHKLIYGDLRENFSFPYLGNALTSFMLPLGCTLAKNVYLWGFDGRALSDKLLWSHSSKHYYSELEEEMMKAHPAFFSARSSKDKFDAYVKNALGDRLENNLQEAERLGWHFHMLHDSNTPALQKRRAKWPDAKRDV